MGRQDDRRAVRVPDVHDAADRTGAADDQVVRISCQSSSGTYAFFREHVLANKDFKLGSRDMNGSKEVVELVANTRTAMG